MIVEYYIEPRLKENLVQIRDGLKKKDKDYVMIVDGLEGSGKSTFAFQIGKFVDPTLSLVGITFTPGEFKEAIIKAEKYKCIIFDEAFTGLSSRSAMSEINRMIVSLMMQMRQKNLFVIIVLPSYFLLDKYVALFRARSLVHVYEIRGARGYFAIYPQHLKKLLYLKGIKTYDYKSVRTIFTGRFYGKFALGEEIEEQYRNKKAQALEQAETSSTMKTSDIKKGFVCYIRKISPLSNPELIKDMEAEKLPVTKRTFYRYIEVK